MIGQPLRNDPAVLDFQVWINFEALSKSKVDGIMKFRRSFKDPTNLVSTFCVGTTGQTQVNTFQYSHAWLFHRPLSDKESCLVYLLGPSVTELEPITVQRSTFPIVRPTLLKKVLIQDAKYAAYAQQLFRSDILLDHLEQLRHHLLLSHCANHGALVQYYRAAFNLSSTVTLPSRNLLQSLFSGSNRDSSKSQTEFSSRETITAIINSQHSNITAQCKIFFNFPPIALLHFPHFLNGLTPETL